MATFSDDELLAIASATDESAAIAALASDCFWEFVKEFWECIPGAGNLIPNWHMEYLAGELQQVAERTMASLPCDYDLAVNISPGTSKSSLVSILFPAWMWTRWPQARILTGSYASTLAIDLAAKSRDVIRSEKYQVCFPGIDIREDTDAKGHYRNTAGGERMICTVGGMSPIGRHAHLLIIDDPLDPERILSDVETQSANRFMTEHLATRKVDKLCSTTILVMQRIGVNDPTQAMIDQAARPGSNPLRLIRLPADLIRGDDGAWIESDVEPSILASRYINGLMDPVRMPERVLQAFRARGLSFYDTQFRQKPRARTQGMFKAEYYSRRVRVAPYACKRVRYWDIASSRPGAGTATAGVLLARDAEGHWYIEHVEHGHWEPHERNERMLAVALRDRARYGPTHEPTIYLEKQPAAAGVDAWRGMARKLAGFRVKADAPTGSKEVRAEPWSDACASGNVFVVDGGQSEGTGTADWDIQAYIDEHCAFPAPGLCDRVDASSGAFNLLANTRPAGTIHVYRVGEGRQKGLRVLLCTEDSLATLVAEQRALLVWMPDPLPGRLSQDITPDFPAHGLTRLLDRLYLPFLDVDPATCQDTWNDPLPLYGRSVEHLIFNRDLGRRLWSFLLRRRPDPAEIYVLVSPGGERSRTVALAIADVLRLPRKTVLYSPDEPDRIFDGVQPANRHLYESVLATRGLIVT